MIRFIARRPATQSAFDTALDTAFATFAERHPRWAESLFDRPLLERVAQRSGALAALSPRALADAWTRQFRYQAEATREQDIARIAPVAADFLGLLRLELGCSASTGGVDSSTRSLTQEAA